LPSFQSWGEEGTFAHDWTAVGGEKKGREKETTPPKYVQGEGKVTFFDAYFTPPTRKKTHRPKAHKKKKHNEKSF